MKKGFTIVELSIVIVVIGILISLFFFAEGVVNSAKVNGIVTEITYLKSAHDKFREKYSFRPGDVPTNVLSTQGFTGYADDTCSITSLGNNSWDNLTEEDLVWLQMSQQKFVRYNIYFDPCAVLAYRDVGTHRAASDAVNGAGWTFINYDTVTYTATTKQFLYVLRVGQKEDATDTSLSKGKLKVGIHMDVDTKIDTPFTPTSGKYYVQSECIDASGNYLGENDSSECVGGFAEVPSEALEETYTP